MLTERLRNFCLNNNGKFEQKRDKLICEFTIAERKAFLTRKKLVYKVNLKVDDIARKVDYSEMLKETGFGLSSSAGDDELSPGFSFKAYKIKQGFGTPPEGKIIEKSYLFGQKYTYNFDYRELRDKIREIVSESGYQLEYKILI